MGREWQATITDLKERNEELQLLLDKSQTESKKEVADAWEREQKMRKDAEKMKARMEEQGDRLNAMITRVRELKDECKKIVGHSVQSVTVFVRQAGISDHMRKRLILRHADLQIVLGVLSSSTNYEYRTEPPSTDDTSYLLFFRS